MTADTLTSKELLDIIQKQVDLVNWYWNFLIVTIAVILGWIVTRKQEDGRIKSEVVRFIIFGFIVFASANLIAICSANFSLGLLIDELKTRVNKPGSLLFTNTLTKSFIELFNIWVYVTFGLLVHVIADVIVVTVLLKASKDTAARP